jgi:hypothetical protein
MTPDDRAAVLVTADLLESVARLDWLSTGLTLLSASSLALATRLMPAGIAVLVLGVVAKIYFVRSSFDARIFRDAGDDRLDAAGLDSALSALALAPPSKGGRSWIDRCRGAKRLAVFAAAATLAQCFVVIISLCALRFMPHSQAAMAFTNPVSGLSTIQSSAKGRT